MIKSYKVRLEPDNIQQTSLFKASGVARWAYNWTLEQQETNHKSGGKFISDAELRKRLTQLKQTEDYKWLYSISNNVTKQAVKDACEAYKRFFKQLSGKPKFKSRKRNKPSFYHDTEKLKVYETHVHLEKIGEVKLSEPGRIPQGKYSNPRITFDGLHWYISVGVEREVEKPELDGTIGIDLGVKETAVLSTGEAIANVNKSPEVKKIEARKKRLQRKLSKKYEKGREGIRYRKTKNIIRLEKKVNKLSRKIANIRNDHIHKATTGIVRTKPSRIVMEDLNVKGMVKNHKLAKAVQDQALSEFKRQIAYKCEWLGIELVIADRWYPSSKTCSNCGHVKPKLSLSERVFKCEHCGCEIDRDLNAAVNLANYRVA